MKKLFIIGFSLVAIGVIGVSSKEELAFLFNASPSSMLCLMVFLATVGASLIMISTIATTLAQKEIIVLSPLSSNLSLKEAMPTTNNIRNSRKIIQLNAKGDEWVM